MMDKPRRKGMLQQPVQSPRDRVMAAVAQAKQFRQQMRKQRRPEPKPQRGLVR